MSLIPRNRSLLGDSLFDDFFPAMKLDREGKSLFAPKVDIREKDGHYEVTAELPGVKKDDIHVTVHDGVLTLEASVEQEDKEEKEGRIIRQERRYGSYARSFALGGDVHEKDIQASFNDGVLKLTVPKAKEQVPEKRRIAID
jgi:HSP20 family protein